MRAAEKMPDIRSLSLFDSCVTLGGGPARGVEAVLTGEGAVAVMDRHGIAEALVCSGEARLVHPRRRGNDRLLRDIAGNGRLHPAWVLTPPDRPDPAGARSLVDEMVSAGVRAARLMMGHVPPLRWI